MNWRLFDRLAAIATTCSAVIGLIYLLIPVLIILPVSFSSDRYLTLPVSAISTQWYQRLWQSPGYQTAFSNTLIVGCSVALLSAMFGTMSALALVRGNFRFARAAAAVTMTPLIMPQIILAIGIFPVMKEFGLIGTRLSVILAHTAIASSLVFITVSAALRGYSRTLELSAMTLGAGHFRTFVYVTLPMIRLGVMAGAVFAFALSFDEVIIAMFLTDASSVTLPVFMWNEIIFQMDPTIAAASTVAVLLSMSLLSATAFLQWVEKRARRSDGVI